MVLPPLPIIRPIKLLWASIFKHISLEKQSSISNFNHQSQLKGCIPFIRVVSFLLHHFQNFLARIGTIFRVAIDGDGFFQRSDVIFSMHVHSRSGLLCYLSNCRTLSSDNSSYLRVVHNSPPRKNQTSPALTISLCTRILRGKSACRVWPGRPINGAPARGPLLPRFSPANSTFSDFPSSSTPFSSETALERKKLYLSKVTVTFCNQVQVVSRTLILESRELSREVLMECDRSSW